MTRRALLLADGPSDAPLGRHVELIAQRNGFEIDVVAPDLRRLDPSPGRGVADRLSAVLEFDDGFDLVIVHRDAENDSRQRRLIEIEDGVSAVREGLSALPIVPIKMTEAWLLVDEEAIRRVAGRPSGTEPLGLPSLSGVESVPDAKELLRRALETASGTTGRRLKRFKRDFGGQRRRLLEGIDHAGPVSQLSAWRDLETDIATVLAAL
jgi:hypothetical protein